jgi:diguanylate cyclase (GGDEF)-like protein
MESGVDDYLVKPLDPEDLQARLINAARVRALHVKLADQQANLERLNKILYEDARTDALTKLNNRRALQQDLQSMRARAERYSQLYSIAICDIDFFKKFNDTCGHAAGDEALKAVASVVAANCRTGDTAYRYGGEEFVVILPGQTPDKAGLAMERIRNSVETMNIPHPGVGPTAVVTISAGVAGVEAGRKGGADPLEQADEALYAAKESGRNQVQMMVGGAPIRYVPPD